MTSNMQELTKATRTWILEFQKDSYPPRWNSEGLTALDREVKVPSTNRFSSRPTCCKISRSSNRIHRSLNRPKTRKKNNRIHRSLNRPKTRKKNSYRNPLGRVFLYRRNLIYCLVATANFQIIIVVWVVPRTWVESTKKKVIA
jgi:hypothetical protein